MAKFRLVHTSFWNDPTVSEEMTPEDKYFFLYLLTNEHTTQIGIYGITKKKIAFELGYSIESVNALLQRFIDHHKLIKYNHETREIAIKNWGKYNLVRGGKPILDCVKSELKEVKDKSLIQFVGENIPNESIRNVFETFYDTLYDTSAFGIDNGKPSNINGSYVTSTISGQYKQQQQEEQQEEEKEEQQQQEQKACRLSLLSDEKLAILTKFYDENIQRMTGYIHECIINMIQENDPDLVLEAFKIAAVQQPKTPLKYIESILRNWRNESIKTLKDLHAKESREKNASDQRKSISSEDDAEERLRRENERLKKYL